MFNYILRRTLLSVQYSLHCTGDEREKSRNKRGYTFVLCIIMHNKLYITLHYTGDEGKESRNGHGDTFVRFIIVYIKLYR